MCVEGTFPTIGTICISIHLNTGVPIMCQLLWWVTRILTYKGHSASSRFSERRGRSVDTQDFWSVAGATIEIYSGYTNWGVARVGQAGGGALKLKVEQFSFEFLKLFSAVS